jgi:hypothetical protein
VTPEQRASQRLFGDANYVPDSPDFGFVDPFNQYGPNVSWNELVRQFEMCRLEDVPNRLKGARLTSEGDVV